MYPGRGPYGGCSSYNPAFARTFASDGGSFQPTRVSGPPPRSQGPPAPATTTKEVRPGEPHHHSTRLDRAAGLVINPLCRCHNPQSHTDSWAFTKENHARDMNGRWMSWKKYAKRTLDFCRKDAITREEQFAVIRYVIEPVRASAMYRHYLDLNVAVRMGEEVQITGDTDNTQFHNGDGHARNEVTESGLRTQVNRPPGGYGRGSFGGSGHPRR